MAPQKRGEPIVVTHQPPRIDLYYVTNDDLTRIEDGIGHVGQDFAFMLTSISVSITLVATLITGTFEPEIELTLKAAAGVAGVTAIYTGARWFRHKRMVPSIVRNIRSRAVDPDD